MEYRLDVVSTRSRHVLAYGWTQPHLDIHTTVRKNTAAALRAPFFTTQESLFAGAIVAPAFLGGASFERNQGTAPARLPSTASRHQVVMQTRTPDYSERGELCGSVPSLWPANSSLISSQASLWSSTDFFSFSPAGSSLRIASSISFRAFDCREKASDSSRGMSGPDCSCCAIS
jgi:hypothetical protein